MTTLPAPTQVRRPWRATLRTAVQTALAVVPLLGLVVPAVVQIILDETGGAMPDGLRVVLLGTSAVVVALAAIVTRVMAIPAVDQLIQTHAKWLAADSDPTPTRLLRCYSCGSSYLADPNSIATRCPSCGSNSYAATEA